jgi:hypothetical protein
MGGVTGEVTGKVTAFLALPATARVAADGGFLVEYQRPVAREVLRPWVAEVPAATLPEEHRCGKREPEGRPLVAPKSNLVTQYLEAGIAGVTPGPEAAGES